MQWGWSAVEVWCSGGGAGSAVCGMLLTTAAAVIRTE